MKKIITLMLIITVTVFAFDAEVKKGSVSLQINDKNINYEAGKTFSLQAGDLVCFLSGEGRVVIKGDKYSKQISKRSKNCKQLPTVGTDKKNYLALVEDKLVAQFSKTKETAVAGVSVRSSTKKKTLISTSTLTLKKDNKYLVLENNQWGPLPVKIKILNKKGEVIASDINENDVLSSFIFSRNVLKDGYTVEVVNAFDEALVKSVIEMK